MKERHRAQKAEASPLFVRILYRVAIGVCKEKKTVNFCQPQKCRLFADFFVI